METKMPYTNTSFIYIPPSPQTDDIAHGIETLGLVSVSGSSPLLDPPSPVNLLNQVIAVFVRLFTT